MNVYDIYNINMYKTSMVDIGYTIGDLESLDVDCIKVQTPADCW